MTDTEKLGVIIEVIAHKGGVGKSLLSINLAVALALKPEKPRVALVEGDITGAGTSSRWMRKREESDSPYRKADVTLEILQDDPSQSEESRESMVFATFSRLQAEYDYIIVDGPPKRTDDIDDLIVSMAHLVIMPSYELDHEFEIQTEYLAHLKQKKSDEDWTTHFALLFYKVPGAEVSMFTKHANVLSKHSGYDTCFGVYPEVKKFRHCWSAGLGILEGRGDLHHRKAKDLFVALRRRILTYISTNIAK